MNGRKPSGCHQLRGEPSLFKCVKAICNHKREVIWLPITNKVTKITANNVRAIDVCEIA